MTLNIAICDDEKLICSQIETIILDYTKQNNKVVTIDIFHDGRTLLTHIEDAHNDYDLIYLDIEMDEVNGVDVGMKIRTNLKDHKMQIVYMSGKEGYERQLFDVQPMLFLPKPIDELKLTRSIDLAIEKLSLAPKLYHYKKRKEYYTVPLDEIICFEISGRNIKVKTIESEDTFIGKIKEVAKELSSHGFIQISQSVIVNYQFVSKYSREEVVLFNKETIAIPKNKRTEVKEKFLREIDNLQGRG